MTFIRILSSLMAVGGVAFASLSWPQQDKWVILIGGDTEGYLSPCGCTKPMTGGIRRRAMAVARYRVPGKTIVLENGGLVKGRTRQDELKAETLAQSLMAMKVDALHLTPSEAQMGKGMVLSLSRLTELPVISGAVAGSGDLPIVANRVKGPFLIGGVSASSESVSTPLGLGALPRDQAIAALTSEAESLGKKPLLMFSGGPEDAQEIATKNPSLALIVYRSTGEPPKQPIKVGTTWLVSPGEHGKALVRVTGDAKGLDSYSPISLGPEFGDEPTVSRFYKTYLQRVAQAGLLDQVPREPSAAFAGSASCASCHAKATKVWKASQHSTALATLKATDHDRDPDCVSCHVVGLEKKGGYRDMKSTPSLAHVGCESCHGPAKQHTVNPRKWKLGIVGEKSCASCHVPNHSPGFSFATYWKRIAH